MIYFIMFTSLAVFVDYKYLKNAKKSNIVFYVCFIIIAFLLSLYHYLNPDGVTITDIVIKLLNMEGK